MTTTAQTPASTSVKVFVGNLSFKTVAQTLIDEFGKAGSVVGANIITRGPRSLGYGFVEMKTLPDANKAVEMWNQKDIDGRTINVEIARPREENPHSESLNEEKGKDDEGVPFKKRMRKRRTQNNNNNNSNTTTTTTTTTPSNTQRQQGNNRPTQQQQRGQQYQPQQQQQYRPRQNQNQQGGDQNNAARGYFSADNANQQRARKPRRRQPRKEQGQGQAQQQGQQQQQQGQGQQGGQQAPPKVKRTPAPKKVKESAPSKTTIFVANLPFAVDDAELQTIFAEKFKVVSAHVVQKRNGRSKGFGFVEFESEEDQQAALKAFDGFTYKERPLNVKVALAVLPGQEEESKEAGNATTTTTTTTTTTSASTEEKGVAATVSSVEEEKGEKKETEQAKPEEKKVEETKAQ